MSLDIGDNFKYLGKKFLDERQSQKQLSDIKSLDESMVPEGFLIFCEEDKKNYQFSSHHTPDHRLGRFRELAASSNDDNKIDKSSISTELEDDDTKVVSTGLLKRLLEGGSITPQSLSLSIWGGGTFEVGTHNIFNLEWTVKKDGINITPDVQLINGQPATSPLEVTASSDTDETITYTLSVDYEDTKGKTATTSAKFVYPSYYGAVSASGDINEQQIKTLTKRVVDSRSGTLPFNLNHQRSLIAYPKSFGQAVDIKDSNLIDYVASGDLVCTEQVINGVDYYVYTLASPTRISTLKFTIS